MGESGVQRETGGRILEWCRQRERWKGVTQGGSFYSDKFGQLSLGECGLIVSLDGTTSEDNATEFTGFIFTASVGILLAGFTRTHPVPCTIVLGLVHWWLTRRYLTEFKLTPVGGSIASFEAVKILTGASIALHALVRTYLMRLHICAYLDVKATDILASL